MRALAAAVGALSFGAKLLMTAAYGALTVAETAVWQQLTLIVSFLWGRAILSERISAATAVGVLVGAGGEVLGHTAPGARRARPTTATTEPVEQA